MVIVNSPILSNVFYTIDTYQTFSPDLLDDSWFDEESEFDFEQYVNDLAELHAQVINDFLPCDGVKSVQVVDAHSPQEYNFYTDKASLDIEVDLDFLLSYAEKHKQELDEFLHDNFTSRDGFWSYTPNSYKDLLEAINMTSTEYNKEDDYPRAITVLAGWYLTREVLSRNGYLECMYEEIHDVLWRNLKQFKPTTYLEYERYVKNNKSTEDVLDIEAWYREYKQED